MECLAFFIIKWAFLQELYNDKEWEAVTMVTDRFWDTSL
jgi:hypothetical protein